MKDPENLARELGVVSLRVRVRQPVKELKVKIPVLV
jgi:hypothetical protein